MSELQEIQELLLVCDHLLGPRGCPWDREQTMSSVRKYALEEVCELIDAIETGNALHIEEELGDLFYNAIFLCRLAEKEGRTTLEKAARHVTEKLVRRHPHVFGDQTADSPEDVLRHWDRVKREEKGSQTIEETIDAIPKQLPALSRAGKLIDRLKKIDSNLLPRTGDLPRAFHDEQDLGQLLWEVASAAKEKNIDPELALRGYLARLEQQIILETAVEGGKVMQDFE